MDTIQYKLETPRFADNGLLYIAIATTANMKYYLLLIAIFLSTASQAQETTGEPEPAQQTAIEPETEEQARKHEVSLDVITALVFPAFNPRYEYLLNTHSSVGAELSIYFIDEESEIAEYETFNFTAFYRQYLFDRGDLGAKGFYAEGFMKYYTFEDEVIIFIGGGPMDNITDTFSDLALGVGIGWKWVNSAGFVIDINLGLGRDLGIGDESPSLDRDFAARGGVNFGWRF